MENGLFLKELGDNIRRLRKERNMSLCKMSEITQIDKGNLSRMEVKGKNSYVLSLKKIARSLGVEVKDLFEGL